MAILRDIATGQEFPLDAATIVIGRDKGYEVRVKEVGLARGMPQVSSASATSTSSRDRGSGQRHQSQRPSHPSPRTALRSEDILEVPRAVATFHDENAPAPPRHPAAPVPSLSSPTAGGASLDHHGVRRPRRSARRGGGRGAIAGCGPRNLEEPERDAESRSGVAEDSRQPVHRLSAGRSRLHPPARSGDRPAPGRVRYANHREDQADRFVLPRPSRTRSSIRRCGPARRSSRDDAGLDDRLR